MIAAILVSPIARIALLVAVIVAFYEAPVVGRLATERRTALAGYVLKVELDAAHAQMREANRQKAAAQGALDEFETKTAQKDAVDALVRSRLEQEIADNEKLLTAQARSCYLSGGDVDFLQQP